jgi:hypothetical protein
MYLEGKITLTLMIDSPDITNSGYGLKKEFCFLATDVIWMLIAGQMLVLDLLLCDIDRCSKLFVLVAALYAVYKRVTRYQMGRRQSAVGRSVLDRQERRFDFRGSMEEECRSFASE